MLTAADERVKLAAFVGVKGLLEQHRNDVEILAKTRELRTVLAADEARGSHMLDAARETFKRSVVVANYQPLLDVARLMFRALVKPAAARPGNPCDGSRHPTRGGPDGARRPRQLRDMACAPPRPVGPAGASLARCLREVCRILQRGGSVGRDDTGSSAPPSAETARSTIANGHNADPVELVLHAQALLQPLIELGLQIEEPAVTQRGRSSPITQRRESALDMASRHGEGVRSAVAVLLNVEATSDA